MTAVVGRAVVIRWFVSLLVVSGAVLFGSTSPAIASFGFRDFENTFINQDGSPDLQAGSHPWEMITHFALNKAISGVGESVPDGDLKDTWVELPAGFIGDPSVTAKCTQAELHTPNTHIESGGGFPSGSCPDDTEVGIVHVGGLVEGEEKEFYVGLFNVVSPSGVPAEFGFDAYGTVIVLNPSVRTGGDYGVTVESSDASQVIGVDELTAILWGAPGDASHDGLRGECLEASGESGCSHLFQGAVRPFLSLPTSCSPTPLITKLHADFWQNPGRLNGDGTPDLSDPAWASASFETLDGEGSPAGLTGCDRLAFSPTVTISPESTVADSPTGLGVKVHLPQSDNSVGLAEANLQKTVVTLPVGMSVNPSAADGLAACTDTAEPGRPEGEIALRSDEPARCPEASKVGSVRIKTPLLEDPLEGSLYVAQQYANPFNSLFALYLVAEGDGVLIKLAGKAEPDPLTGQLTTVFEGTPQQPFSDLELTLFGGPRATLVTPAACGTYIASSSLTPYSTDLPVNSLESFPITDGCASQFSPSFMAGTTNTRAGGFSPFTTTISRSDQDQDFNEVALRMPPGLVGLLSKIALCGEPQATLGACPAASQIGHVTVGAGAGSNPVFLPQAGRQEDPVFLTGPYKGAPFGLAIVNHAEAGPFNLGLVVVRAAVSVDPHTAQVIVKSDPLPQILQGVPLQLRTLNVTVDRAGFLFDPTNCTPRTISGTLTSTQGETASVSNPYQARSCSTLPFKPKFTVSTLGQTSKARGASLNVKVTAKGGPQPGGGEANISKVDVQLPKLLPARLTTLQKACLAAQFETNPAGCPAASNVGTAIAHTPVLSSPLAGPAYLVSHGGAAFPDLEIVLQGNGVTLVLDGGTQIKKSITYSHFETVPDAPISSFELKLPEGPHSVLTSAGLPLKAHGSFCQAKLMMPTKLTAQNGAILTQSTKVAVIGCPRPKSKPKTKHQKR